MKKVKRQKMRKSIGTTQLNFNCKFNNEQVFDEVTIRVTYRSNTRTHLPKRRWAKLLKPSLLFKHIAEVIKTMF